MNVLRALILNSSIPLLQSGLEVLNNAKPHELQKILDVMYLPNSQDLGLSEIREDIDRLVNVLELNNEEIYLIFKILYMLKDHTDRIILKPTELQTFLNRKLKINATATEMVIKAWSIKPSNLLKSMVKGQELDHVTWETFVTYADKNEESKEVAPEAKGKLQLVLKDNQNQRKQINLLLDRKRASVYFEAFEKMQLFLDRINESL